MLKLNQPIISFKIFVYKLYKVLYKIKNESIKLKYISQIAKKAKNKKNPIFFKKKNFEYYIEFLVKKLK